LTDTESLISQYRKKVAQISDNVTKMKVYKQLVDQQMEKLDTRLSEFSDQSTDNHKETNDHLDRIALKYQEDITDVKASGEGLARELERQQALFRELQSEFLHQLEEKRINNETLLRGA